MNIVSLIRGCKKNYNLSTNDLRSVALGLCTAGKLEDTCNIALSVDRLVAQDTELDWSDILVEIGIDNRGKQGTPLPRVQKLRVISDMLSILLSDKISDLRLSSQVAAHVARIKGVSLAYDSYPDEGVCYANLKKIEDNLAEVSVNYDDLNKIYRHLEIYVERIKDISDTNVAYALNKHYIPEQIYHKLGKKCTASQLNAFLTSKELTQETYISYIIDNFCIDIIQLVVQKLLSIIKHNESMFNLIMMRANRYAPAYLPIGMYSLNNYTPRVSAFGNIPSYLKRKVGVIFSESSAFSEGTILGCIVMLYFCQKFSVRQDFLLKEMEGLVDECNHIE